MLANWLLVRPRDGVVLQKQFTAKQQGAEVQTFLVADAGYNPYTTVVNTRREVLQNKPALVKEMISACREGWTAYLANPKPANEVMGKLNKEMDAQTFAAAAETQKPLIENEETKKSQVGAMTTDRWDTLVKQLVDLKVIDHAISAADCFVNPE